MTAGTLFVISAPSGTGKTTLLKKVMAEISGLAFSVSHTTRKPRPGERNGVDYHFVSREEFEADIEHGLFIEYAPVHDNLYGTNRRAIAEQLQQGMDVILDIDTQGAEIIRSSKEIQAVDIFIAPPSVEELERRLRGRGTEKEEEVRTRLGNATQEMMQGGNYLYLIVNGNLAEAVEMLKAIILAERAKSHRDFFGKTIKFDESL